MHRHARTLSTLLAFWAYSTPLLQGQNTTPIDGSTPPAIAGGQPAGSYALSGFETVNLFGGGLNFHLPLVAMKGRGTAGIGIMLGIQQRWVMERSASKGGADFYAEDMETLGGGQFSLANYSPGTMSAREVGSNPFQCTSNSMYQSTLTRLTFTEADGTEHEFIDAPSGGAQFSTSPTTTNGSNDPPIYNCSVPGPVRGKVWITRDGSFSTFISDNDISDNVTINGGAIVPANGGMSGNLYRNDGTRIRIDAGHVTSIRDRNGNFVSYTYGTDTSNISSYGRVIDIADTLNRHVTITYATSASTNSTYDVYDTITYLGVAGNPRAVKVHYCTLDPSQTSQTCPHYTGAASQTLFALFAHQNSATPYNPVVVSFVELPDSRRYEFSYNAYGELTRVKLPTGGSFRYAWDRGDPTSGEPNGIIGSTGTGGSLQVYRRVTQRQAYTDDGATMEGQTVYGTQYSSSGCPLAVPWFTVITAAHEDPAGNILAAERHSFYGGANDPTAYYESGNFYSRYTEGREYLTEELNASLATSSNLMTVAALRSQAQGWEERTCDSGEPCPAHSIAVPAGSPVDTRVNETDTTLVDSSQSSKVIFSYDRYNNVTDKRETQFGNVAARHTHSSYLTSGLVNGTTWDYVSIPAPASPYGGFTGDYTKIVHIRNLLTAQTIYDASGSSEVEIAKSTIGYDDYSNTPPSTVPLQPEAALFNSDGGIPAPRGNATRQSAWFVTAGVEGTTLDTYRQYDVAGNVVKVVDPLQHSTAVAYSNAFANAFPTTVTNALNQSVSTGYDFNTGKPISFTGPNGSTEQITYTYSDPLDRLTQVNFPASGVTQFAYCDSGGGTSCVPGNSVTKTITQNSCGISNSIVSDSVYDGLGRVIATHAKEESGTILVQTTFDAMGRTSSVSNPTRAAVATDFTYTTYDSLSRVKTVTAPSDTSAHFVTTYNWLGNTVTTSESSDTANVSLHYTQRTTDALGRLTSVIENSNAAGGLAAVTTNYAYDMLDNLIAVCQGGGFNASNVCQAPGRGRSFSYDSFKRLLSANNPESGITSYAYDAAGNLHTKTDSRSWVTTFSYDALNRELSKTYSNTTSPTDSVAAAEVDYTWDSPWKGRLSSVTTQAYANPTLGTNAVVSSTQYSAYDTMGRVLQSSQTTNGSPAYPFTYTYNLAGSLETETYPSTRSVTTCYDLAGRVSKVSGKDTPSSSVTNYTGAGVTYAPHGAIQTTGQGSNLTENWTYNKRLQPTSISVGTSSSPQSVFGTALYYCSGQQSGCASNNGNLIGATLPVLGALAQQNFSYDPFNRLLTAAETADGSSTTWMQTYGHDIYANHWVDQANSTASTIHAFTPTSVSNFNSNNQLMIQSSAYDAAGNQKLIGGVGFVSDAENRMVLSTSGAGTTQYSYDGDGRRVWKSGPYGATTYVYDALGALAAEYGGSGVLPPCKTCYLSVDHLGSTRAMTDGATGVVVERHDYLPFGEDLNAGMGARTVALKYRNANDPEDLTQRFTGKERDIETAGSGMPDGLDYFGARYYSGAQGRFTTPDAPFADQHPEDPQSWNMYAYVRNNPLKNTDPTGRDCQNGFSACLSYMWGGAKQVLNLPSDTTNLVNHGINRLTGSSIPDVPTFKPANEDERQGMEAAGVVMMFTPVAAAGLSEITATSRVVAEGGTVTRYMGPGEAAVVERTGAIPNTNAAGEFRPTHVTTDAPLNSGAQAQTTYELPSAPTHRATVPADRVSNLQMAPDGRATTSGGGSQAATHQPIPVKPEELKKLNQ